MNADNPAERLAEAASLLKALGHPLRLGIAQLLGTGPMCVHELTESLDADQPLVSQHLRVLRGARVVAADRSGREVVYRLEDEHVSHIVGDAIIHVSEGDSHVHH